MKTSDLRWTVVAVIVLAGGCGGGAGDDATRTKDQTPQPPPSGVLLDAAKRPLERAQDVDQITKDHKNALDEQLKQSE
jgi:hypothetical protein